MENYVAVLGAGAWGTAVAHLLATNGHWVCLYTHESDVATSINQTHQNSTYLADVTLPPNVWATTDVEQAARAQVIFVAYPVPHLRTILAPFRGHITIEHLLVTVCKGMEVETGKLPFEIVGETVGVCHMAVVGGPNFAAELTKGVLTGAVVAARSRELAQRISDCLSSARMRITLSDDPIGVQLCGALKNVIALNIGIITGQGASENTKSYLLTEALHEAALLIQAYNGRRSTAFGLAGLGDTVLSAMSEKGRNFTLGMLLGRGISLEKALLQFASPPEGLYTARALGVVLQRHNLNVPILAETCKVIEDLYTI